MTKKWNARTSALGGYSACSMRAWLDHGLQAGHLNLKDWGINANYQRTSSPPADYGTCCHWYSQSAMRCEFMPDKSWNKMKYTGWNDEACQAAAPTKEQWINGSSLFASDAEAEAIMKQMAIDIHHTMPRNKKTHWMAEACFQLDGLLNGHIDFLSDDLLDIVDLKTTGKKPSGGKAKASHVWQLVGYALGVYQATGTMPENGHIIYAHNRGDWIFRTNPVKFQSPMIQRMKSQLLKRLTIYADWDKLSDMACPSFGEPCNDFCPYTDRCLNAAIPRGKSVRDKGIQPLSSSNPLA